ncbi:hypothetical protein [Qipengyuania zhejiangensis]|uniref:hypothetical protein n=1 Tax=Qipengyuania zhejiangensis TaxID=3077782 RepID=UPI002D778188|nr:hypothetical protein [Qipengyuania sp. Z2]
MDPNLLLIFAFIIVIASLAFSMAHIFHKRTVAHEERKLELQAQIAAANAVEPARNAGDYRKLEERVRVLERIATDGNHALAAQIEQLRDLDGIDAVRETAR